ncbi:MAG: hypothetical protein IJ157_06170 [Clostridia bacterium]|nr:hypothetical protein [Clostridia bacterium]
MAAQMLGLDAADCAAWAAQRLDWKRCGGLKLQADALCAALVQAHVDYLHACGALDGDGDTGEGEYDEDEAVEFLLDALLRSFPADDRRAGLYCALIDAFLPLFDDYLLAHGLLSL